MERTNVKGHFIYIGIDPGSVSGGMAIIGNGVNTPSTIRFKDVTDIDLCCALRKYSRLEFINVFTMIESVHSMPKQGVVSAFNFGENYGMLQGFLIALKIPFKRVLPTKWQSYYGMKKDKDETQSMWKRRLRQRAQELYPDIKIITETADAILIANYCKETWNVK